ncbi:MAG: hypothetical protein HY869_16970 [Chloroflexi bacterium]|nr:hypothetical protein [Chloroflexota bacterium]
MNFKKQTLLICLVLLSVFITSCSLGQTSNAATSTAIIPTASSKAKFTPLPTLTPTLTPSPTITFSPTPSPTPVPAIGDVLRSDNWEATILEVVYRKNISIAGTVYTPKPGYIGFDVIMKVNNLNFASTPSTSVENDVVIDAQGIAQLATCWGAHDVAKSQGKDLLELTFVGCQTGNIYTMKIENESYIRFHFTIEDTNLGKTLFFKFEDLPAVPFIINRSEP